MQLHLCSLMSDVANSLTRLFPCQARHRSVPIIEDKSKFESMSEDTSRTSDASRQHVYEQSTGKIIPTDHTLPLSSGPSYPSSPLGRNVREQRDETRSSSMPRYDIWSMAEHQQSFCEGDVSVSDGHLMQNFRRFALVRLALAASEQDHWTRYMFQDIDPLHVLQVMRHMVDDWVEDKDTILYVARVASKESSSDPVGWICCTKIRREDRTRRNFELEGSKHQSWNVATAMRLRADREAGLKGNGILIKSKYQELNVHTVNQNYILDLDRQACLSTQQNMFPDRDYLLMNMFAIHPKFKSGLTAATQLLDAVFEVAFTQKLPMLVPGGGEAMQELFRGCYGFQEKGAVAHFQHVPNYFWKFWYWKPGMRTTPKTTEEKEEERRAEIRRLAGC